jgi:uncharacterized RDD family membrane protein YckC
VADPPPASPPADRAPADPQARRPPRPLPSPRYAGLVSRVAAIVVDTLLLTLAVLVIGGLPPAAARAVLDSNPNWLATTCAVAATVLPWAYFTACWWLTGETAGDLVFGLRVRRTNRRGLSLLRAGSRALAGLLLAPLWTVGLLTILVDPRRRALHDYVFGTAVEYTQKSRDAGVVPTSPGPARPD